MDSKTLRLLTCLVCSWHLIVSEAEGSGGNSRIVQRSDGCGPHPLVALVAASRPYGSGPAPSLSEVLRTAKANPDVWATMSILLRRYDDCIRAGDGLHFKRAAGIPSSNPFKSTEEMWEDRLSSPTEDLFQFPTFFTK